MNFLCGWEELRWGARDVFIRTQRCLWVEVLIGEMSGDDSKIPCFHHVVEISTKVSLLDFDVSHSVRTN